jgi:hypothetical protein
MEKTRVSLKQIAANLEAIAGFTASIRTEVENMPSCSKRKSLLVTVDTLEKKVAIQKREVSESAVMDYVNAHPEVLQKFAHFAASDKGAVEVASEVVTTEEINNEQKQKGKKRRV